MASFVGYTIYTISNFYPAYYTMIPAAAIQGTCGGCLWTAQCAYFTTAGQKYAKIQGINEETAVGYFFGIP